MSEESTQAPTVPEGKKRFEVKMRGAKGGGVEKAIFIDEKLLDWQIDMNSYVDALRMGPVYQREIQQNIEKHFVDSVSDFLDRRVTMKEIKEAIQSGWI